MKPHVLLINPWIHDFSAYNLWYKPLGLLYIASLLKMNGVDVSFIDCLEDDPQIITCGNFLPGKLKADGDGTYLRQRIKRPLPLQMIPRNYYRFGLPPNIFLSKLGKVARPDIIMITTMMTYWYPGLFEIIPLVKEIFPGAPIAIGGNYVTLCPKHAKKSGADFCLPGAGEASLPRLFKELLRMDLQLFSGPDNHDSYSYPAFDLLCNPVSLPIMTSRGCPYHCSYCASHLLYPDFRRRDPILVAREIEFWHQRLGVRNFSFYDDALLVNSQEMAAPLLKELIRKDLRLRFHCPNGLHLREVTPEISSLMRQSGFKTIRFGFETSDLLRQKQTGGKVNNEELKEAVKNLKSAGYEPSDLGIYLLCGLPGQSAEEVADSIRYVQSCGARPILAEYSPIPGTELWPEAVASSPDPVAEEPLFQNNTLLPCRNESFTIEAYRKLKLMARERKDA
jgi:radical SAM superfamily enzyme YgiQ (UPF0313 family)